jgi:hypothetical protein
MARRWVEACVGEAFHELAAAGADVPSEGPAADGRSKPPDLDPKLEQRQFARNYLEKLLNIEVRIPKLTEQGAETVLSTGDKDVPDDHAHIRRVMAGLVPIAGVLLVGVLLFVIGRAVSMQVERLNAYFENKVVAAQPALTAAVKDSTPVRHSATPTAPITTNLDEGPADVEASPARVSADWYVGAGLPAALAICALIAVVLLVRRQVRTDDSQNFRRALAVFRPWILLGGDSPRSLKRFVNHLRYIAMRFRSDVDPPTLWDRTLTRVQAWFTPPPAVPSEPSPARASLEEPLLVALAAIYRCNERWLDVRTRLTAETLDMLLGRDMAERFPDPAERRRVAMRLTQSIQEFNEAFPAIALYKDEMQDRRHIVAFCDVMAAEAVEREPFLPEKPSPPTQLHAT